MKKEKIIDFVIFATTIALLLYLTLMCLTIYTYKFDINDYTLIAGIIGFVGAILGGIISGMLTLKGVRLTIKENKDKELKDSLPGKLLDIEDIIFILERQYILLIKHYEKKPEKVSILNAFYNARMEYIIEYLEKDGLLKKSANVNVHTYRITRRFYTALKNFKYNKGNGIYPYEQINTALETTIASLKVECEKLIKQIEI